MQIMPAQHKKHWGPLAEACQRGRLHRRHMSGRTQVRLFHRLLLTPRLCRSLKEFIDLLFTWQYLSCLHARMWWPTGPFLQSGRAHLGQAQLQTCHLHSRRLLEYDRVSPAMPMSQLACQNNTVFNTIDAAICCSNNLSASLQLEGTTY